MLQMHTDPILRAPPSLIWRPRDYFVRLDLAALFPETQSLEVELGSGDGGFMAAWAARHPQRNFLGVERLLGRIRKLDRKGQRAGLSNLRLMRIEAGYLMEYLLPPQTVSALHVYFPDPWPKRRHRSRRLINEHFARIAAEALLPGGTVYLRTDDADYFQQMETVLPASRLFEPAETPVELLQVKTDFEREFHARGIQTFHAAYRAVGVFSQS